MSPQDLFGSLPASDPSLQIADLRGQLEAHAHRYYVLDEPSIPDVQYDRLMRELQELEEAHPHLRTPDSPTQRVGGQAQSSFQSVSHARPMLSIRTETDTTAQGALAFDARIRKELGLSESLHKILQVLSVTPFEQAPLDQLLTHSIPQGEPLYLPNQLMLWQ